MTVPRKFCSHSRLHIFDHLYSNGLSGYLDVLINEKKSILMKECFIRIKLLKTRTMLIRDFLLAEIFAIFL